MKAMTTLTKKAALMCRVSSDEQALGYSLDVQKESLEKYCQRNNIEIVYQFKEDHSAKSFNRPAFKEFLGYIEGNRGTLDTLIFTSWDRFSRNLTDAFVMIQRLKKHGITPMAIEQPIDMSIPENLAMLAIFLAIPEIDNVRRSIKIRGGVRGALKAGRWPRVAPFGYRNMRDDEKKAIIVPSEDADHVRYIFKQIANGGSQEEIRNSLRKKEFNISRSAISDLLRNPMYIGKICVPAEGEESSTLINGIHEGLITEALFYKVQGILNENKTKGNKPNATRKREELPLRGSLICSKCGCNLTGSASRSKTGKKHYYYHCNHCHQERFRAFDANESIYGILASFKFNTSAEKLYKAILQERMESKSKKPKLTGAEMAVKLKDINKRITNLQDMLADGKISAEDYTVMKTRYESDKVKIEQQNRQDFNDDKYLTANLDKCLQAINQLDILYNDAGLERKRSILSSTFPGKLIFDGIKSRTPRLSEVLRLALLTDKGLREKKNGQLAKYFELSAWVELEGVEPAVQIFYS